jgi:hypothetical protein
MADKIAAAEPPNRCVTRGLRKVAARRSAVSQEGIPCTDSKTRTQSLGILRKNDSNFNDLEMAPRRELRTLSVFHGLEKS